MQVHENFYLGKNFYATRLNCTELQIGDLCLRVRQLKTGAKVACLYMQRKTFLAKINQFKLKFLSSFIAVRVGTQEVHFRQW